MIEPGRVPGCQTEQHAGVIGQAQTVRHALEQIKGVMFECLDDLTDAPLK